MGSLNSIPNNTLTYLDSVHFNFKFHLSFSACHLILYVFAAVFGIANYVFLQQAMELVNHNCLLFPRELEFHTVELIEASEMQYGVLEVNRNVTDDAQADVERNGNEQESVKEKREANDNVTLDYNETATDGNVSLTIFGKFDDSLSSTHYS